MTRDELVDWYAESFINNMLNILDSYEEKIKKLPETEERTKERKIKWEDKK